LRVAEITAAKKALEVREKEEYSGDSLGGGTGSNEVVGKLCAPPPCPTLASVHTHPPTTWGKRTLWRPVLYGAPLCMGQHLILIQSPPPGGGAGLFVSYCTFGGVCKRRARGSVDGGCTKLNQQGEKPTHLPGGNPRGEECGAIPPFLRSRNPTGRQFGWGEG